MKEDNKEKWNDHEVKLPDGNNNNSKDRYPFLFFKKVLCSFIV